MRCCGSVGGNGQVETLGHLLQQRCVAAAGGVVSRGVACAGVAIVRTRAVTDAGPAAGLYHGTGLHAVLVLNDGQPVTVLKIGELGSQDVAKVIIGVADVLVAGGDVTGRFNGEASNIVCA